MFVNKKLTKLIIKLRAQWLIKPKIKIEELIL